MPTIKLEHVSKNYKISRQERNSRVGGKRFETGVRDVNLTIEQGEFVFLIGSSGAGKSTLLNLISGRLKPDSGTVYLGAMDLAKLVRWSNNRAAAMYGRVWQEHSLIRKMTVTDNLLLAARIGRKRTETNKQMQIRAQKVLGLVGMARAGPKYPVELSVGECRRVELARAMINSPPVLVLDEITANLDDDNIWDIFHLLTEINRKGTTVIMATHASQYVNIMHRRVITLVDGRVFGDVKKGRYGDVL